MFTHRINFRKTCIKARTATKKNLRKTYLRMALKVKKESEDEVFVISILFIYSLSS